MNFLKMVIVIINFGKSIAFKICGNYCGENWCNGKSIPEEECDTSAPPDKTVLKADECCMSHDECCGHGDRKICNNLLIECIKSKESKLSGITQPALDINREDIENWFYDHFMDPIVCGISMNATYIISDFFEAMNLIGNIFGKELCCGSTC
jgi:hypothetical protein